RLPGPEVLDRAPERRAREGKAVEARVGEGEDPAVAAAIEGDELAGPLGEREGVGLPPDPGPGCRQGRHGHQPRGHLPEWLQVAGGEGAAELVVATSTVCTLLTSMFMSTSCLAEPP